MNTVQPPPAKPDVKDRQNGHDQGGVSQPEKLAPCSVEAEEAVLGSILINPDCLPDLAAILQTSDFYIVRNGRVWEALIALHERSHAIDNLTVIEELRSRDRLDGVGGSAYITYLINNTPTHIHGQTYGQMVRTSALRRRLLAAAGEIAQTALEENAEIGDVIAHAESALSAVADSSNAKRFEWTTRDEDHDDIDTKWLKEGILAEKSYTILFGDTGSGKSAWFTTIGMEDSQSGDDVLMVRGEAVRSSCKNIDASARTFGYSTKHFHYLKRAIDLTSEAEKTAFIADVKARFPNVKLIGFDTLVRCLPKQNLRDIEIASMVANFAARIINELGATPVFLAHTGKDAGRGVFGSKDWENSADTILEMTEIGGVHTLKVQKQRGEEPGQCFAYRKQVVTVGVAEEGKDITGIVMVPTEPPTPTAKESETKTIAAIRTNPGISFTDLLAETGIAKSTLSGALRDLQARNLISKSDERYPKYNIVRMVQDGSVEPSNHGKDGSDGSHTVRCEPPNYPKPPDSNSGPLENSEGLEQGPIQPSDEKIQKAIPDQLCQWHDAIARHGAESLKVFEDRLEALGRWEDWFNEFDKRSNAENLKAFTDGLGGARGPAADHATE